MILPEMGESVTEGSIVEWRRKVGEFVSEGDALVEVTTDKVDVEVPATASGQITQILAREGDTVPVGTPLAQIDTAKHDGAAHDSSRAGNGAPPAP
ncbi:MAG TPA: lipoyl domain-containing protein, partial [Candidatus Lustribacter sp.]|nr:lipoyl domain-containing protein [Candidatus Lustribacter sp.]